ncbi:MAG: hypothetical protein ACRD6W_17755 [Nitrososphaerales archaeon]
MSRAHALIPLTEQERQVDDLLLELGLTHLTHAVFPNGGRLIVVDFFLSDRRTVIECWKTTGRRGVALGWMERNAAFIDVKFRRLKGAHSGILCVALAEAPQIEPDALAKVVGELLPHADRAAFSVDGLRLALVELGGVNR